MRKSILVIGAALTLAAGMAGVKLVTRARAPAPVIHGPQGPDAGPATSGPETIATALVRTAPKSLEDASFEDATGQTRHLSDYRGRLVVVNLWATWCGPCVKEMPALDRLRGRVDPARIAVLAIALDRGGRDVVRGFFDKAGIASLEVLVDPTTRISATLAAQGLPTTLILDTSGREIARIAGAHAWDAPDVATTLAAWAAEAPAP